MVIFRDVVPCDLVVVHRHLGGTCYFNLQSSSEKPLKIYRNTRRHIPEDNGLHTHLRENLRSFNLKT
jgi:hypothetical protein